MKNIFLTVFAFFIGQASFAQTNPVLYSWIRNLTNATGYGGISSNIQSVKTTNTDVYISASCIPGYDIGPWAANPNTPVNQNFVFKITRNPIQNTSLSPTNIGNGHTGIWTNGVSIFNVSDAMSYNNAGVWNRDAYFFEGASFDNCLGHPAPNGEYHHHVNPKCLYDINDSTHHSPIIGYAFDGFPIYGAYGYTGVNGTGTIKRIKSSYVVTTATTRINGPSMNTTYQGTIKYTAGCFIEDWTFVAGAGDLDFRNGRFCVTPEFPGGTYAYFSTIDSKLKPSFPYTPYKSYYGVVQSGNSGPGSGHNTIPATATAYTTAFVPGISVTASETSICPNAMVNFTAAVTNGGTNTLYIWRKNGTAVSTSANYSSSTLANGDMITCDIISNAYYLTSTTATSNAVTMTVKPAVTPSVAVLPSSTNVCAGTTVIFTATPSNGGSSPVYQWKKSGLIVGTNSNTYSDNTLTNSQPVQCILTSNADCASPSSATSGSIEVVVNPLVTPGIAINTPTLSITSGTSVTFSSSIVNGGATPVYLWKKNGTIVGTASIYTDATLINGDVIQCVLTSNASCLAGSTATSNSLTMSVISNPTSIAKPVILPASGTFSGPQTVSISCATSGASIYYTTTGNTPVVGTGYTKLYTGPFNFSSTGTIRAMAIFTGLSNSAVDVSYLTITNPGTVATPSISPVTGSYSSQQLVSISCTTSGASIYYTTTGNTPSVGTSYTKLYSGSFTISATTNIKAIGVKSGSTNSTVASNYITISNPTQTVANPIISPITGTFSGPQTVSISCATLGATIYYTTSGNTPVVGTSFTKVYTGSFIVTASVSIKAMATLSGSNNSGVSSSYITISGGMAFDEEENRRKGIEDLMHSTVNAYPNPSSGIIHLEINQMPENGKIEVINSLGIRVYSTTSQKQNADLDISQPAGLYSIQITGTGFRKVIRMVKQD